MSLFGFLASQKPSYSDKVWMAKPAALKGMMTEALQALTQSEIPIVITFFADRQQEVIDFVSTNGVPYTIIDATSAFEVSQEKLVLLLDAHLLKESSQAMNFLVKQSRSGKTNLLFYGHHPIPEKENQLITSISNADKAISMKFFSSLDDRAFEMFGPDNIKSLMEKMGLPEDEAIEHAMVSKAMARAREKVASTVTNEITTNTEAEWYQRNVKRR